jgi:hypothetical protein
MVANGGLASGTFLAPSIPSTSYQSRHLNNSPGAQLGVRIPWEPVLDQVIIPWVEVIVTERILFQRGEPAEWQLPCGPSRSSN